MTGIKKNSQAVKFVYPNARGVLLDAQSVNFRRGNFTSPLSVDRSVGNRERLEGSSGC
jgi:hypothetical protein